MTSDDGSNTVLNRRKNELLITASPPSFKLVRERNLLVSNGAFSIDAGLELLGVVGPVRQDGLIYNLQPTQKGWSCDLHRKGDSAGVCWPPL